MTLHHISDSDLERYYTGTFEGMELALLDEHLLWCIFCCERLANVELRDPYHRGRMQVSECSHG